MFKNLFREFREYRRIRGIVRLGNDKEKDQQNMAALVGMPGFHALKGMLMAQTIHEIAARGPKSERAAGMAFAVGVMAECERYQQELAKKVAGKTEDEDQDEA